MPTHPCRVETVGKLTVMRTPETHAREVAAALPVRHVTTVAPVSYTHLTLPTTPYV